MSVNVAIFISCGSTENVCKCSYYFLASIRKIICVQFNCVSITILPAQRSDWWQCSESHNLSLPLVDTISVLQTFRLTLISRRLNSPEACLDLQNFAETPLKLHILAVAEDLYDYGRGNKFPITKSCEDISRSSYKIIHFISHVFIAGLSPVRASKIISCLKSPNLLWGDKNTCTNT